MASPEPNCRGSSLTVGLSGAKTDNRAEAAACSLASPFLASPFLTHVPSLSAPSILDAPGRWCEAAAAQASGWLVPCCCGQGTQGTQGTQGQGQWQSWQTAGQGWTSCQVALQCLSSLSLQGRTTVSACGAGGPAQHRVQWGPGHGSGQTRKSFLTRCLRGSEVPVSGGCQGSRTACGQEAGGKPSASR